MYTTPSVFNMTRHACIPVKLLNSAGGVRKRRTKKPTKRRKTVRKAKPTRTVRRTKVTRKRKGRRTKI